MLTARRRVGLTSADLDSLAESETTHEAIEFEVLLYPAPDEAWIEEFDIAYRILPNNIKPPVKVHEDRMLITYLPRYQNDLQAFFEFIKTVMGRAEEEIDKTEAIARHSHQPERIAAFRDVLRKVRFDAG
jgi:hypothetical protein